MIETRNNKNLSYLRLSNADPNGDDSIWWKSQWSQPQYIRPIKDKVVTKREVQMAPFYWRQKDEEFDLNNEMLDWLDSEIKSLQSKVLESEGHVKSLKVQWEKLPPHMKHLE